MERVLTRALRRADCHLWEGVLRLMDTCLDNGVSRVSSLPLNRFASFACNASLVQARHFQQNFPRIKTDREKGGERGNRQNLCKV